MDLLVNASGFALWGARRFRCTIGRGGISAAKREGDGATPAGSFPLRFLLFRPDRETAPRTSLPIRPLMPSDGWCDAAEDMAYNRLVQLPYGAGAESLWREDHVYDLIVPLGYNDVEVVPGKGSAIFLHLATPDFAPTAGCVALAHDDLVAVLGGADETTRVVAAA